MNDVTKDLLEALKDCERVIDILWVSHHANRADAALKKARAAIARAEAALSAPQPEADGWIPWAGGECPLKRGVRHQVRFRDGDESDWSEYPYGWNWEHTGAPTDIIAYRVVEAQP